MFDEDFSFLVEQKYPYPIAVAFRRLETDEYMEKGAKRLKGVLEVAERTLHFLAHVVLINLYEDLHKGTFQELPRGITADFEKKFGALSFGSLIQFLREGIRLYAGRQDQCFMPELYPFHYDEAGKPTEAALAFESLVAIRNKLAHPIQPYTSKELVDFCEEAEKCLSLVLERLNFITRYELLNVNQIEVVKKRRSEASFKHRFSRIVGVSENFKAKEDSFPAFMDSRSMVLKKKESFDYLDLSPLVLYSAEGEKQVPDVFLYLGQKGAGYIYSACNNGGVYDSRQSALQADLKEEMEAFAQAFKAKGN